MVAVSNAVPPVAAAMASGVFTCFTCIGQLISPFFLSTCARALFKEATPGNMYKICVIGMVISAAIAAYIMMGKPAKDFEAKNNR